MKPFKKILKWFGIILLSVFVLALILYAALYVNTEMRIDKQYFFKDARLEIPTDSASIKKGEHLYRIRSCIDCHGAKGEGGVFLNDPSLMELTAPNITRGRGGLPAHYNVADWVRVIRHGLDANGRSLYMMPSHEFYKLSDEDLGNLIAYCMQTEPVHTDQKRMHSIGPIGRLLMNFGDVTILPAEKIDHNAMYVRKQDQNVSAAYGKYLISGCQGCHRDHLQGGGPLAPGFPPVPDITANGNLGKWSEQTFISTIRNGKTPEGKVLDNKYMPWKSISHFDDDEMKSIYRYLKTLPQ